MATRAELIALGVCTGAIGVAGVAIGPALLSASSDQTSVVMPNDPAHAQTCEAVAALFENAVGIVRVWTDDDGRVRDALLWHADLRDPDVINRNEIVLLSFSPILGTLTSHACTGPIEPDLAGELGIELEDDEASENPCAATVRRSSVDERFPLTWKTTAGVSRDILASGMAGVAFEPVREPDGTTAWGVQLIWGDPATDVDRQVCALVVPAAR